MGLFLKFAFKLIFSRPYKVIRNGGLRFYVLFANFHLYLSLVTGMSIYYFTQMFIYGWPTYLFLFLGDTCDTYV